MTIPCQNATNKEAVYNAVGKQGEHIGRRCGRPERHLFAAFFLIRRRCPLRRGLVLLFLLHVQQLLQDPCAVEHTPSLRVATCTRRVLSAPRESTSFAKGFKSGNEARARTAPFGTIKLELEH
jgi:hypothetical protein